MNCPCSFQLRGQPSRSPNPSPCFRTLATQSTRGKRGPPPPERTIERQESLKKKVIQLVTRQIERVLRAFSAFRSSLFVHLALWSRTFFFLASSFILIIFESSFFWGVDQLRIFFDNNLLISSSDFILSTFVLTMGTSN